MPFPRISGVLNNCPLHVLTPELRTEITLLAEGRSMLSRDFIPGYELFKTKFAEFYGIEPTSFAWQAFAALLKPHNDFDLQMILGPVLRDVMAETMRAAPAATLLLEAENSPNSAMNIEGMINYKTQIQKEDGRYASLSPDEMFLFVARPLGLAVAYTKHSIRRKLWDEDDSQFAGRPCIEMFHQGGVEGAGAGGHFERTLDAEGRIDSEHASDVHLRIVAELFKQDSAILTEIGIRLLRLYMKIVVHRLRHGHAETDEMFHTFHLTAAQIEKFLYNRWYVSAQNAQVLLGELTAEAAVLIASIPELGDMEYDVGIQTLLLAHLQPDPFIPVKQTALSDQQYEIALTLLTPPVPQRQAHTCRRSPELPRGGLWALQANEISALQSLANDYAERVIFNNGLSGPLYALCNRPEIARELLPEFLDLLATDPDFETKASSVLAAQVSARQAFSTPSVDNARHLNTSGTVGRSVFRSVSTEEERRKWFSPGKMPSTISNSGSWVAPTPYSVDLDFHDVYTSAVEGGDGLKQEEAEYYDNPNRVNRSVYDEVQTPLQLQSDIKTPPTSRKLFDSGSDEEDSESFSAKSTSGLRSQSAMLQPLPSELNAYFWLRAIQGCLAIGGVCAMIAVLTCTPVAAALGLTTVFGVAVSDIAVTTTFLAGTSALLAASLFAVKQTMDDPVVEKPNLRYGGTRLI
ncbi:MAG: hypothetical protein KBB94_01360 [Legionellaceae bacterium]|nr:hypothetical protein [Legionellaceae bacterium]MBP9774648.1 hypothetical protein [Legionellaceae bacterium]